MRFGWLPITVIDQIRRATSATPITHIVLISWTFLDRNHAASGRARPRPVPTIRRLQILNEVSLLVSCGETNCEPSCSARRRRRASRRCRRGNAADAATGTQRVVRYLVGCARRIRSVDAGVHRRVQVPPLLSVPDPPNVAARACPVKERCVRARRWRRRSFRRRWRRREAVLVGAQRRQLGRDHVRRMLDVDPEPRVGEVARPFG